MELVDMLAECLAVQVALVTERAGESRAIDSAGVRGAEGLREGDYFKGVC